MRGLRTITIAVVAVAVVGAGAVWLLNRADGPGDTVKRYLAAWTHGDYAAMRALTDAPPAGFRAWHTSARTDLGLTGQRYTPNQIRRPDGDRAAAAYRAELTLAGGHTWRYTGSLPLVKRDGTWRVRWSPAAVHPKLRDGQRLRTARTWPPRARILDADGGRMNGSVSGSVRQLVGPLGRASAGAAKRLGTPYRPGDTVGTDGLQHQYEQRLAGKPSLTVQVTGAGDRVVRTLARFGGAAGKPLRTTIDPRTQQAAGHALSDADKPASLVAIRPSTGEILAVANKPGGYNRALMGRYPPGSTFKVVTAAALVADGIRPGSPVGCPARTKIGGRTFKNYHYEDFGTVPLREAFAHSCNTTFARLAADKLGKDRLAAVAGQFGFNKPIIGGLPAARASFPRNRDDTALASASFGQGEVLTSPLNMAAVAAAAADGTWRTPRLVTTTLAARAADAHGSAPQPPRRLEPAVRRALHSLMPAVVSEGTARSVTFPSGTAGKTGTAEFGSGAEPPTHAWFIGYRGDLAFSVLVEDGGTGTEAAAPIAATFLRSL